MSQSALERKLVAAELARGELQLRLRDAAASVDRLEADRRFLAEREAQETAEKEQERALRVQDKVRRAPAPPPLPSCADPETP
jgi:mitotic spindle assembly checkpoint protein MAD1